MRGSRVARWWWALCRSRRRGLTRRLRRRPQARVLTIRAHQPDAAGSGFDGELTGDWWGQRRRLQDAGVTVGGSLTLEGFMNFKGGVDTAHAVGATTFDLNVALDTEKLLGWHGGEFYVGLEGHAFRNPTQALVGDLQVFDKDNSSPYLQFYEVWYQQKMLEDTVRIKIGKVDANTEFSVVDNGQPFVNSSSQVSPTIFVFPTTPDPAPSFNVFFTPNDMYFASFGAYYANRSDYFGDLVDHPASVQPGASGVFMIGETGLKWHTDPLLQRAGNLKVGVWEHTGTFTRFDGERQHGTYGYYGILDQTLWQPQGEAENGRGVRAFLEYGGTENDINAIDRHIGGGVTWTGLMDSRPADIVGFGPQYAAHRSLQEAGPLVFSWPWQRRTFYQWQLTPWASHLQPDVQYIVHPGGAHADALVLALRMQLSF